MLVSGRVLYITILGTYTCVLSFRVVNPPTSNYFPIKTRLNWGSRYIYNSREGFKFKGGIQFQGRDSIELYIFQGVQKNGWCLGCLKKPSLRVQTAPELEDAGVYYIDIQISGILGVREYYYTSTLPFYSAVICFDRYFWKIRSAPLVASRNCHPGVQSGTHIILIHTIGGFPAWNGINSISSIR